MRSGPDQLHAKRRGARTTLQGRREQEAVHDEVHEAHRDGDHDLRGRRKVPTVSPGGAALGPGRARRGKLWVIASEVAGVARASGACRMA